MEKLLGCEVTAQDKVFHEQALQLANHAAMALEEAMGYADDIENPTLRKLTQEKIERMIELL